MVPRIAKRGHSFKGAAQYYLHDKNAQTDERVAWTHTHNLPTNDPQKGFGWMAHTAIHADRLKHEAGVSKTGRKSTAGVVYSFSLSWHPDQNPSQETQQQAALDTLTKLRLSDHEAIVIAHRDEAHPHVHIICNLVHPENGKVAVPSYDRLTLSKWAENLERADGEILCEQRVINNQRRREEAKKDRQLALIKHKEAQLKKAVAIEDLYHRSDSGKAFQAALDEIGYTLAKGDRRGFVLVDKEGTISSLSRQIKGQRAKDIREYLKDIDTLPDAKDVSNTLKNDLQRVESYRKEQSDNKLQDQIDDTILDDNDRQLHKLDALRAWDHKILIKRAHLESQQEIAYKRQEIVDRLKSIQAEKSKMSFIKRVLKKDQKLQDEQEGLNKNLANIDMRIKEQNQALALKMEKEKPTDMNQSNKEELRQQCEDRIRDVLKRQGRGHNRNRGLG